MVPCLTKRVLICAQIVLGISVTSHINIIPKTSLAASTCVTVHGELIDEASKLPSFIAALSKNLGNNCKVHLVYLLSHFVENIIPIKLELTNQANPISLLSFACQIETVLKFKISDATKRSGGAHHDKCFLLQFFIA